MKKLDPVRIKLSALSSREQITKSRQIHSSLLMVGERRRKIKSPLGSLHIPTVIDTTSPHPILS